MQIPVLELPDISQHLKSIENPLSRLMKLYAQEQPSNKIMLIETINKSWYYIITVSELRDIDSMG